MPRIRDENKQSDILKSALQCFSKFGYSKTTISDIAKGAGVAPGTIYLYFEDKAGILKAAAAAFHAAHVATTEELFSIQEKDPDKLLEKYVLNRYENWLKEIEGNTNGTDLLQAMAAASPEINAKEQGLWRDTIVKILKLGARQGHYRFSKLESEGEIFLHCLIGFFPLPGFPHPMQPNENDLKKMIRWFTQKWRHDEK